MLYLAIDGGGTKTEGLLTDETGVTLARKVAGASNPHDITPAASVAVLTELVRQLLTDAGLSAATESTDLSVFAGVAGVTGYREQMLAMWCEKLDELSDAFSAIHLAHVGLDSDVTILLAAEIPEGDGACVISGTGAVCFLRQGMSIHRIGGWGYLLDSGGSGYNIGRDAVEAVLRAHDGRGAATALTSLLEAHYGQSAERNLNDIYSQGKAYIASCAPCVFAAASEGDTIARDILLRNAQSLAELIETACRLRTSPDPLPVVMGGGLCQNRPEWVALVAAQLPPALSVHVMTASKPPVMGALELARHI